MSQLPFNIKIPHPAPKTEAEFNRLYNPFMTWITVLTVLNKPVASNADAWPKHYWRDCACKISNWYD